MTMTPSVFGAFAYLQGTSIRNAVLHRLKRLRQPKYLIGAIVGGLYFYGVFFRRVLGHHAGAATTMPSWMQQAGLHDTLLSVAALVLLLAALTAWIVPSGRAALTFSEAEVAFLFPAPLTRRTLVHYKLLRSQLAILVSALLITLVSRRASMFGGHPLLHAAGWWLVLSTLRLHFIGASFWRDRLLEMGISAWLRRLLVLVAVAALLLATGAWLHFNIAAPTQADLADVPALSRYVEGMLSTPPLAWLLLPFKWLVAPLFALDATMFLRALPATLAIVLLHYFWVVHSDTAFEEASIEASRRRAERLGNMRAGRSGLRRQVTKPRRAAFELAPHGPVVVAFLWKNLIALGPLYRLRHWLLACVVVIVGGTWLRARPELHVALQAIGSAALMIAGWTLVVGPMLVQRGLGRMFEHLDVLKASPLSGRQVVLGELLTPIVLMTLGQWLALLVAALAFVEGGREGWFSGINVAIALVGIGVLAPLLCGLMLCVPFAGLLLFPAWLANSGGRGGGVEVMGQRMIFFAGYLLVLVVALLPAVVVAAIAFFLGHWLGNTAVGLVLVVLCAGAVLVGELQLAVAWLGRRLERIDISREQAA